MVQANQPLVLNITREYTNNKARSLFTTDFGLNVAITPESTIRLHQSYPGNIFVTG